MKAGTISNTVQFAGVAKRNIQLDVLRCVAILLVIGAHIKVDNFSGVTGWVAKTWQANGWLGVPIFFALSGFLISGLIFDEVRKYGSFSIKRFLIRRGFKLYPAYFVFLLYLITIPFLKILISGGDSAASLRSSIHELWPNFLFINNYVGSNPELHTWSLAVEEHFYLLLPFLMLWLHRKGSLRWLAVVGLMSPVIFAFIRTACLYLGDPYMKPSAGSATHLFLDGLLVGVGLRALKEYEPALFAALGRWRWLWIAIGVYCLAIKAVPYVSLTPVGSVLILLGALHLPSENFGVFTPVVKPIVRLMGWVGLYSYSIYLWHPTFMGIVSKKVIAHLHLDPTQPGDWLLNRSLIVVAIILGGWFTARVIEWPVLRIRDRYFPRRA